ncbi:MAG: hypothetical protein Q4F70_04300 [Clostridia bacterium]|nr:hypothetical protein [Clostridia bacterium]
MSYYSQYKSNKLTRRIIERESELRSRGLTDENVIADLINNEFYKKGK